MSRPVAIEVRDVAKSFRIPDSSDSLSRRLRSGNPFRGAAARELHVLKDVSFDVHLGEFFGIVGRNGSGKSTLLKMITGIYGIDRGRIRVAGRLAPFLELGVGFNPDLAARENVALNGVMMGLSTKEAARRYEEIIDFAGLKDYTDLKLKNYSSGMKVRLGFAVMTHVDADVLLVDEVLAVGDAEFREKCEDVFEQMHAAGRTIVLVTHSMEAIVAHCERAMLIDSGTIDTLDEPQEIANRYAEVNLTAAIGRDPAGSPELAKRMAAMFGDPPSEITDIWLANPAGERTELVVPGDALELHVEVKFTREVERPSFYFRIYSLRHQMLFESRREPLAQRAAAGEGFRLRARLDNHFAPGRFLLSCAVSDGLGVELEPISPMRTVNFRVDGEPPAGTMVVDYEFESATEPVRGGA